MTRLNRDYKSDDPARRAGSPYFLAGREDGARDALELSQCPPGHVTGWDPEKSWSVMYVRGYEEGFTPSPCPCDGSCRPRGAA